MIFNFLNEFFNNKNNADKRVKPKPASPKTPKKRRSTEGVKKTSTGNVETTVWHINDQEMPVEIHRERRTSWRYSFGKNNLIVRIPKVDIFTETKLIETIQNSLKTRTTRKPTLLTYFESKTYKDGEILIVGKNQFILNIKAENRKTNSAKIKANKVIELAISDALTEGGKNEVISTLLSRIIGQYCMPDFSRRVNELNHLYFKKPIKSINFKNNHTNWGSCSSSGNLNFSTRLLFTPEVVQDYVIIHELAHLIELNHSHRFWKLVADAMPEYDKCEKWLKKNGASCRF